MHLRYRQGVASYHVSLIVAILFLPSQATCRDESAQTQAASERVYRHRPSLAVARRIAEIPASDASLDDLRVIQQLLELDHDSFGDDLRSIRLRIESLLQAAPSETRRRYERLVDDQAVRLLNEARTSGSLGELRRVSRQYFLSGTGATASERLIARWIDAGEFDLAVRLISLLKRDPIHRQRISPALSRFHDSALASRNLPEPSALPAVDSSLSSRLRLHRARLEPLESDWMLLGGNPSRNRAVVGSPPVPNAEWRADFFSDQNSRLREASLTEWEGGRRELEHACCPAAQPIVVQSQLIFRDLTGVRSLDAASGRPLWSVPCLFHPVLPTGSRLDRMAWRLMATGIEPLGAINAFAENSLMGTLTADGRHVYMVDSVPDADPSGPGRFANRLMAVTTHGPDRGRVAWVHQGNPDSPRIGLTPSPLTFLGPPLPGPTELLALIEQDMEVQLLAIDPATGSELWRQPLCSIDRNEQFDLDRHELSCVPTRANGIAVCPTHAGVLVAIDLARQALLWAKYVDDVSPEPQRSRASARSVSRGGGGLNAAIVISDNSVFCLSPFSSHLHCLDLETGQTRWSAVRPTDMDYIAAAADGHVVLAGRLRCCGLAMNDGHEVWSTVTGPVSGRGILIGRQFAVPLESGHIALVDLATGRDLGTRAFPGGIPLGHLAADRDRVYSLSHWGVVAFPQMQRAIQQIRPTLPTLEQEILDAEISLVQGDSLTAAAEFQRLRDRVTTSTLQTRISSNLKGLLFERLRRSEPLDSRELSLLASLLDSPAEEFRFVVATGDQKDPGQIGEKRWARAYALASERYLEEMPGEPDWRISPAGWCRLQFTTAGAAVNGLRPERDTPPPESTAARERYLRVFSEIREAGNIRNQLARDFSKAGRAHAAETLWLRNLGHSEETVAAEATLGLMELWERSGFIADATRELERLAIRFADVPLPDGQRGASFVRSLPAERPVKAAWLRSQAPRWPIDHVEIRQAAIAPGFAEQLESARGQPAFQADRVETALLGRYLRSAALSVDFVMSTSAVEDQLTLSILDQKSRTRLGALQIPLAHQLAVPSKQTSQGHSIPLGVPSGLLGISTLQLGDSQPAWTQFPADLAGRRSAVIPGPSGADFATFSWRNRLYVIDPLDGALLWERQFPTASTENPLSVVLDVIGDREVLAVRGVDRSVFDVFETRTGARRETVRTGFVPGQWQGAFGRHVIGFAESEGVRRLEIRDLKSGAVTVSELVGDVTRQPMILPHGDLMVLGGGGELKVYDIAGGKCRFVSQLDRADLLPISFIRVITDKSRIYVNLQRIAQTVTTSHFNQPLNVPLPGMNARDDLYAFDRQTGELQWKRAIPSRTVLQFPETQCPLLVTMSLVKHQVNNAQSLTVEVFDASTGLTIGFRDNLKIDQFLTADYDGQAGRIVLEGLNSSLELSFDPVEGQTQSSKN